MAAPRWEPGRGREVVVQGVCRVRARHASPLARPQRCVPAPTLHLLRPSERRGNPGVGMAGGAQNSDLFPVFPRKMMVRSHGNTP